MASFLIIGKENIAPNVRKLYELFCDGIIAR